MQVSRELDRETIQKNFKRNYGLEFDYYKIDEFGGWTLACNKHLAMIEKKDSVKDEAVEGNDSMGVCGVRGCYGLASEYVDLYYL